MSSAWLQSTGIEIVGQSPGLLAALETVRYVARTAVPVLIVGETGTGKELLAQLVHRLSDRGGPLVDVDCGAIPGDLFEALLFGHRRGAFTGAVDHAKGLVELSHGGTLFLDEMGSLPQAGQAKLLRVLESGRIRRVGATYATDVDMRVVATLQEAVGGSAKTENLRRDLLQRVAGVVVRLPPLAERPEDIAPLAHHFARRRGVRLTDAAAAMLHEGAWPGNVRELRWMMERAALYAAGCEIGVASLARAVESGPGVLDGHVNTRPSRSRAQLRAACATYRGDPKRIAEALGVARSTLYRKVREAGIDLSTYRRERPGIH